MFMAVYRRSNYLRCQGFKLNSNNTLSTTGGEHIFNYAAGDYMHLMANPNSSPSSNSYNEYVVHFKDDGNSGYLHGKIISQTTDGSAGSQTEVVVRHVGIRQMRAGFHIEAGKGVLVFANQNSQNKSEYKTFVISPTGGLTYDTNATTVTGPDQTTNQALYHDTAYDPDTEQQIIIMTHDENYNTGTGNRRHGWGYHLKPNKASNHDFYIGVAANAAADGGTVTVKTVGQVADTEKTDFTNGTTQYLAENTTSSSTQVAGITTSNGSANTLVGRAISSTKMIVSYNYGGGGRDGSYQVD